MRAPRLRYFADFFKHTPLHPQWLMAGNGDQRELLLLARGRVLDIGCANRWVKSALPKGCQYLGLDYPLTGTQLYKARPDVLADGAWLPLSDGSIDTVMMFEVLEHIEHPHRALKEAARVLKSKGRLLLTIPFLYPTHDEPYDYQRYTRYGLAREVENAGFELEQIDGTLDSVRSAGLLLNLALAGMLVRALETRSPSLVLFPFVMLAIPVINLSCWLTGQLLPNWKALTVGYQIVATKS